MHRFANPTRFMRLSRVAMPWVTVLACAALLAGLWLALGRSPPDYQQGEAVRIMYVHVPSAWMALFIYASMAAAAAAGFIWRHPLADVYARAAAPIGAGFTLVCLATGSLWGQPMWGTWWAWDARMTSVLLLFFLYLGYIALAEAFDDPSRGGRAGAILLLAGVVNLPIIKFSVDWWNTLHQPASVLRIDGPAIHASMLVPLLMMALAFKAYFVALVLLRMQTRLAAQKAQSLLLASALDEEAASGQTSVEHI
jgi:heme exporter protein C